MKRRIAKRAALESARALPGDRLLDMPLAKRRRASGAIAFMKGASFLRLDNLEAPLFWGLDLLREGVEKDAEGVAAGFNVDGSRDVNPLAAGVPARHLEGEPEGAPEAATIDGITEFGLQTDDDHEYFLSNFGDLVGVLRLQRKADGTWKAGLEKSNVPRVLSADAVANAMMPPLGHSALPKSLEDVVPSDLQYWRAPDAETARAMRDALVEDGFFSDDTIKAVDGQLRKVEVRYFLFEPGAGGETEKALPTLASRVSALLPEELIEKSYAPMAEGEDWLEALDAFDAPDRLAILSPVDRVGTSPREMARAVKSLEAEYLLEHDDTRYARACFRNVGVVFKVAGEPSRVFCSSFAPPRASVTLLKQGPTKSTTYQGLPIMIDRPKGYVQTGKDEHGNPWTREYLYDYGFLPKTQGGDGMELDVFVGPADDVSTAYWVTQNKADGSFDEFKVFVGFEGATAARAAYLAHVPERFYGGMSATTVDQIKALRNVDPVSLAKRIDACAVKKVNGISLEEVRRAVGAALAETYAPEDAVSSASCAPSCGPYVEDLYPDAVIFTNPTDGQLSQQGYSYSNGVATLEGDATAVVRTYVPATSGNTTPASPEEVEAARSEGVEMRAAKASYQRATKRVVRIATTKADGEERYVLGIVLEPDVVDAQQDTYSATEVKRACEGFMEMHRNMGLMHKQQVNDKVQILENYLAPIDMKIGDREIKKGTWLMGVRVKDDTLWKAVRGGDLTGFSIGGSAVRTPVT